MVIQRLVYGLSQLQQRGKVEGGGTMSPQTRRWLSGNGDTVIVLGRLPDMPLRLLREVNPVPRSPFWDASSPLPDGRRDIVLASTVSILRMVE